MTEPSDTDAYYIAHHTPPRMALVGGTAPMLHAIFRIGIGLLFLEHGLQKVFGLLGGMGGPGMTVPLGSMLGVAGILELVGGTLIVIGFFTRPVAFVLLCEMIVAFVTGHLPMGGWPVQNHGELALLYAFCFLLLAGYGAGPWSVDAAMGRTRRQAMLS